MSLPFLKARRANGFQTKLWGRHMRATVATTGLGVALMALLSMADTAGAQSCLDRTVTIADLAAEMNRCNPAKLPALCSVNPPVNRQFIHKQVAAYDGADIPRWLERGPAAKLYDCRAARKACRENRGSCEREQRRQRANLFDIQFFRKAYGAPGEYQIGANIMYTRCPPIVASCPRSTVSPYDLAAELTKIYHCNPPVFCMGQQPGEFRYKQIAGYGPSGEWLARRASGLPYDASEQDEIITKARKIAQDNMPPLSLRLAYPYFVYDIQFFPDAIYTANDLILFVGANITYARCPGIRIGGGTSPN